MKVRHATSFNRPYSDADAVLADELLREWGKHRGLQLPLWSEQHGLMAVQEDDFGAWAGYCMTFDGHYNPWDDDAANKLYGSRLRGIGRPLYGDGGRVIPIRGQEEYYPLPDVDTVS